MIKQVSLFVFFIVFFVIAKPVLACTVDENGNPSYGCEDPCRGVNVRCGGEPANPPTPTPIPYLSSFDVACQFAQNTGGVERLATDAQPFIISSLQIAPPTYSLGGSSCPAVPTPECKLTDDEGVTMNTGSYGTTKCSCHFPVPPNTCIGSNTPMKISTTSLTPCTQSPSPAETANLFYPVVGYSATVSHDCTAVGPWIKVIDTSFTHPGKEVLVNDQPFIIDSFDQSDTDLAGMSGGASGVVINVDVGEMGRVSKSWWTLADYMADPPQNLLSQHAATLLRTMPYQVVLPTNGVLTLSTEHINVLPTSHTGTIKSFISSGSGKSHVLIVADGNVLGPLTLTGNAYNTGGSAKSLLILSSKITFADPGDVQLRGIVIADQIDTGSGNTLKVTGNLICTGSPAGCTQRRSRTDKDHARPSVLIRLDPDQYLNLLPYLGKQQGEWGER